VRTPAPSSEFGSPRNSWLLERKQRSLDPVPRYTNQTSRHFLSGRVSFGQAQHGWSPDSGDCEGRAELPHRENPHAPVGNGSACIASRSGRHAIDEREEHAALEWFQQIGCRHLFGLLADDLVVMRGDEDPWRHRTAFGDPPVQFQS